MTCNRSTTISSVVAVSCSLITIIRNICRYFHGTCSSASPRETKAGTRWCRRKLRRSFAGAVSSATRNVKAVPLVGGPSMTVEVLAVGRCSAFDDSHETDSAFESRVALHCQAQLYRCRSGRRDSHKLVDACGTRTTGLSKRFPLRQGMEWQSLWNKTSSPGLRRGGCGNSCRNGLHLLFLMRV